MSVTIKMVGMKEAVEAVNLLEGRLKFKHMRIALNAAMAPIKKRVIANAPVDTGLLSRSIRIKVKIPDASYDPKHHGRPAYGIVGPGRGIIGVQAISKKGKLGKISARTKAASQKLVISGRGKVVMVRETQRFKGSPDFGKIIIRPKRASRYAHFTEKGRKGVGGTGWMARAAQDGSAEAYAAFAAKIAAGLKDVAAYANLLASRKLGSLSTLKP